MKYLYLLGAFAAGSLFSGCGEFADTVRNGELLGEMPPRVRTFSADPRATYAAARSAIAQMNFRFTHGGPSQGELRAVSSVMAGDNPGSAHQYTLRAQFHPTLDGNGTEVSVRMTEVLEADSERHEGQGTETPLRDTSLPEVFFDYVQAALAAPPAKNG